MADDPSTWGERRRRREEERRRTAEHGEPAAAAPLTRRQLREAERTGELPVVRDDRPAAGPPAPAGDAPTDTGSMPRTRPVVRPRVTVQRPQADDAAATGREPPGPVRDRPFPELAPSAPAPAPRPVPPSPPVLPGSVPARRRPRWLLPGAALAALLLVLVGVVLVRDRGDAPGGQEPAGGTASVRTALVAVEQAGQLTGAALLAVSEEDAAGLLVPSRLVVDVAGGGRVPLAESLVVGDGAPGQAVADALDLRVDGTWVLTAAGLAQLVDALGGVVVDVDTEVRAGEVLLVAGPGQRLTGAQAAAFATYLAAGEAETVRLARLDRVLGRLLAGLPADAGGVADLLEPLAEQSRTTLPDAGLPDVLAAAAGHAATGGYGATVLPVREISTGSTVLYGVDDAAAAQVLAGRFAGARVEGAADAARVLVQNGVGTPGLGEDARDRLVAAGFRFVGGGNAQTLGRATSAVLVPRDRPKERELGLAVAAALGLPPEVVAVGQDAPTTAEVVVVLGADFAALAGRSS